MEISSKYDFPSLFKKMAVASPDNPHPLIVKKGIELGVERGEFSHFLLDNYDGWERLYGIDQYECDGIRDHEMYIKTVESFHSRYRRVGCNIYYTLLKLKFSEAVEIVKDESFDFIFIDGAEGFEEGKTLSDWYPKVRPGGIFAGRAYDEKFPNQIKFLDRFLADNNLTDKLNILQEAPRHLCGSGTGLLGGPDSCPKYKDFVRNWYLIK